MKIARFAHISRDVLSELISSIYRWIFQPARIRNTPFDMNAEFPPPQCCQDPAIGVGIHVLLRDIMRYSRVYGVRVCVVTATSTRFHRTVIDRGSRCGSRTKSTLPYQTNVKSRAAYNFFNVIAPMYLENPIYL